MFWPPGIGTQHRIRSQRANKDRNRREPETRQPRPQEAHCAKERQPHENAVKEE